MPARLSISQPSPATVLFTISNAPTRDTLLAKLIFYLGVLLRIFSFITVLLIDIAKLYDLEVYNGTGSLASLLSTRLGALAYRIAHGYSLQVIAVSSCVVLYLATRKGYTGALDLCKMAASRAYLLYPNLALQRSLFLCFVV